MRVQLDTVTFLVAPPVFLVWVGKMQIARQFLLKAESSRSLCLVLRLLKFRLDNKMLWTPGVREVDQLQIYRLKAVMTICNVR